jgi:hypothetical protein
MATDPKSKTKATNPDDGRADSGHMGYDDRGNRTWEWADDDELLAEDTLGGAERVRALVDPRMQIKDDEDPRDLPVTVNAKGLKSGYNPYNSGALGKQQWKKKKNLRELSKWIELRKKVEQKKQDEDE